MFISQVLASVILRRLIIPLHENTRTLNANSFKKNLSRGTAYCLSNTAVLINVQGCQKHVQSFCTNTLPFSLFKLLLICRDNFVFVKNVMTSQLVRSCKSALIGKLCHTNNGWQACAESSQIIRNQINSAHGNHIMRLNMQTFQI